MKAIVVGWFSWPGSDFTAGDLLVCDLVCEWLREAGVPHDVAGAPALPGAVDLRSADPSAYSHAVFVCGPFMRNHWEAEFFGRFADCVVIGVNVSLPVPLVEWNLFDRLFERDSSEAARPDLSLATCQPLVPVVGVCLVEAYAEANVDVADAAVARLIASREMAVVLIDTRLDVNRTGFRSPAEIESVISRMDAMITTRLHGTVLALKHGVPALVIDPEPGGFRIRRQAETLGWPAVFTVDALDDAKLARALEFCLSEPARRTARQCAERARPAIEAVGRDFMEAMRDRPTPSPKRAARVAFAREKGWTP